MKANFQYRIKQKPEWVKCSGRNAEQRLKCELCKSEMFDENTPHKKLDCKYWRPIDVCDRAVSNEN
jgi:hypothetical protein